MVRTGNHVIGSQINRSMDGPKPQERACAHRDEERSSSMLLMFVFLMIQD